MTPELLQTALARALASSAAARGIHNVPVPEPPLRRVQEKRRRPQSSRPGDWVSTIALRSAASLHTDPRLLAEEIASQLRADIRVADVEVAGPGFLNITVSPSSLAQTAADIVDSDQPFGPDRDAAARIEAAIGQRILASSELQALQVAVGTDALRFLAARSSTSPPQPGDTQVLRTAHSDNPMYAVQLAHSAARRVERRAAAAGIDASDFDANTLTDARETALAAALADFITTTRHAASWGEPQRITCLLEAIAQLFLDWAQACSVTPSIDEKITRLHASRLVLDRAAIIVLATGLRLLGVSAPERM